MSATPRHYKVTLVALGRSRFAAQCAGETIVETSDTPVFDAARELLARGAIGTLCTRHAGANHWSMQLDIETAAKLRTIETPLEGPRIGKWKPFPSIPSEISSGPRGARQGKPFSIGARCVVPADVSGPGAQTFRPRGAIQSAKPRLDKNPIVSKRRSNRSAGSLAPSPEIFPPAREST